MPQSFVLIDYDRATHEIRRIIHPENDSHIVHHRLEPGWGRVLAQHAKFPVNHVTGRPLYSLSKCADEVQRQTGVRPPNAP
jgi:hypothetical protein